jgi:TAT (twin-arginine translocation) pathway signal sequence
LKSFVRKNHIDVLENLVILNEQSFQTSVSFLPDQTRLPLPIHWPIHLSVASSTLHPFDLQVRATPLRPLAFHLGNQGVSMQSDQRSQSPATSPLSRRSILKGSASIAAATAVATATGLINVTASAAQPDKTSAPIAAAFNSHEDFPGGI